MGIFSTMSEAITALIPMPIQIVIDDVGWWSGRNGSADNEPYRTGIARDHAPADYQAIVDLGRAVGMRPQAAMILCEWDAENILREVPTSTWMGAAWDNAQHVGPWLEEAAEIIRAGRDHFELTLHGIGHEYWGGGSFTRAEWHDRAGTMRPRDDVLARLDCFRRILDQHRLGPFPTSFVPCAFLHRFGGGLADILYDHGVDFISSPFSTIFGLPNPRWRWFDVDGDTMTVDRGGDRFDWNRIGCIPSGEITHPTIGLHWPNLLHADPARNGEIVAGWAAFLNAQGRRFGKLLARDNLQFRTQLAHHVCTSATVAEHGLDLDFTEFARLPRAGLSWHLAIQVIAREDLSFSGHGLRVDGVTHDRVDGRILHTVRIEADPARTRARVEWRAATSA